MERAAARARLVRMIAPDREPTLTTDEIDELVDLSERADADGLLPDDDGWAGVYDLNAAAAEGFRWKAAKVAGLASFSADGASYDRGKLAEQLTKMAERYDRASSAGVSGSRILGSIEISSALDDPWASVPIANL